MKIIERDVTVAIMQTLFRGKSVLLLGPRQTGKTTLVLSIRHDLYINLMNTRERQRYESDPGLIIGEIRLLGESLARKPLVILDEIQRVPALTDNLQILIDEGIADCIITGSSARKIKNLLPGRVIKFNLHSLDLHEISPYNIDLKSLLTFGSLPGIVQLEDDFNKEQELGSYVELYLEEEIRKEALVRNIGAFNNFLQLACIESGNIVNLSKLSQEINVSHSTVAEYYRILTDCMLAIKIEALTDTASRRRLTKSPKYLLFDLGVRRVGARENIPSLKDYPKLFEQFVGLEILKIIDLHQHRYKLYFWRDHAGPEVDFVLFNGSNYIPIEVKWSEQPKSKDIRHVKQFMAEYSCNKGYVICRTPRPYVIEENIIALPWGDINTVITGSQTEN